MAAQPQPLVPGNPFAAVGQAFQGLANAAQQHPFAKQLCAAAGRLQRRESDEESSNRALCRLPPRVVVMPRHAAMAALIPGDSVTEQVLTSGVINFLQLYNSALIVRLVLTWFPNPPEAIVTPLATVCDPYLNLFRGIIPPIGGTLDLSPILAFVILNFFTSTAMALPAEIGPDGRPLRPKRQEQGWTQWLQPSRYEQMWQKRVAAQKAAKEQQQ